MTRSQKAVSILIFAITAITLFASFGFNAFRVVPQQNFAGFQSDSQSLVKLKLVEISSGSHIMDGGFLRMNKTFFKNQPLDYPADPSTTTRYNSQLGFQGLCFSVLHKLAGTGLVNTVQVSEKIVAFLTALLLSCFIARIFTLYGGVAGLSAFSLIIFSVHITLYAHNLYWVSFLIYAPYVVCALLYPRISENEDKKLAMLVFLVGIIVYFKCLCGYEFVTVVILGSSPALLYEGVHRGLSWRKILSHQLLFGGVAVVAFISAFVTHVGFLSFQLGSYDAAWAAVLDRVSKNTVDMSSLAADSFAGKYLGSFGSFLAMLKYLSFQGINFGAFPKYGDQEYYAIRATYYGLLFLAGLITLRSALSCTRRSATNANVAVFRAIAISLPWSFLCSICWIFLARTHSINHFHLCSIIFIAPFMLHLCYCLASYLAVRFGEGCSDVC